MDVRDMLNDPNTPVWDMLADGGIDLDLVSVDVVGTWNLISGDTRLAFGPAETETGDAADGWDWTRYERDENGEESVTVQDWAKTDGELLDALKSAIA
jgi:hypothetical protein